jgi:hypothetical protein
MYFTETHIKRILGEIKYFDEKRLAIKSPSSSVYSKSGRGNIFHPVALIHPKETRAVAGKTKTNRGE